MPPPRAILLAGDYYHNPEYAFEGVGSAILGEGLELHCTTDYATLGADTLADAVMLVILRDGIECADGEDAPSVAWMRPEQEEAIERFVTGGGAFLALHNAGWGYPWQGGHRRPLGGYYIGHPPLRRFSVEVVNTTHPVTAGVEDYEIEDEQHWLHWDYDRVTPLLVSRGPDGRQSVSGWAHTHGKGRVVYLPHGHTLEAIRHPMFQTMLRNAIRWSLRRIA